MWGLASPGRRQVLPNSLMQRLALLADGRLSPGRSGRFSGQLRQQAARFSTLVCFGLGALTSSVLGGVTLLGLRSLNASETRTHIEGSAGPRRDAAPEIVDVAIERSERAHTALSLRVEGADDPGIEVVLQGVPASARLSKGRRHDALTWVVGRAELDGLYLTLGEAGPDSFDMRIDVLASSGAAMQAGIVRVRVVDTPKHANAGAPGDRPTNETSPSEVTGEAGAGETSIAKLAPTVAPGAGRTALAAAVAKVVQPRRADARSAGAKSLPGARPWPEGASGLGAIPRDAEQQPRWSLPPPSWSPFATD